MTPRRLWRRWLAWLCERQARRFEQGLGRTPRPPESVVRIIAELAGEARDRAAAHREWS